MAELTGTIERHRAVREDWAVACVLVEAFVPSKGGRSIAPGERIDARGNGLAAAQVGERVQLEGELEDSARYGLQFSAELVAPMGFASPAHALAWLTRLHGVGHALARALSDRFGGELLEVLDRPLGDDEIDPLTEVRGINGRVASEIRASYSELGKAINLDDLRYLSGLGLTTYETNKIAAYARRRSMDVRHLLAHKPYDLRRLEGFGFKRVDRIALKAGCSKEAPMRVEAAVVWVLDEACSQDTLLRKRTLMERAASEIGVPRPLIASAITRAAARNELYVTKSPGGTEWLRPKGLYRAELGALCLAKRIRTHGEEGGSSLVVSAAPGRHAGTVTEPLRSTPHGAVTPSSPPSPRGRP